MVSWNSEHKPIRLPDITQHMPIPAAPVSPWWPQALTITADSDAAVALRISIMDSKNLRRTDLQDDKPTLREFRYTFMFGGFFR